MPLPSAPPSSPPDTSFRDRQAACTWHRPSCVSWLFCFSYSSFPSNTNETILHTHTAIRPHRTLLFAWYICLKEETELARAGSLAHRRSLAFKVGKWLSATWTSVGGSFFFLVLLPSPAYLTPAAGVSRTSLVLRGFLELGCRPCLWDPEGVPLF